MAIESLECFCACFWLMECVKLVPCPSNRYCSYFSTSLITQHWPLALSVLFCDVLDVEH